jgi:hypothetical protein
MSKAGGAKSGAAPESVIVASPYSAISWRVVGVAPPIVPVSITTLIS